jgi:hypothetical protein
MVLPEIYKHGFIMNVTEETIFEVKIGAEFMRNFNAVTESMAISLEKERLSVILGITNTYNRNGGPIQSTYANTHTQGDGDNLIAGNPFVDYLSLEASDLAFDALTDPDTGEPIEIGDARQIVAPRALRMKIWRAINARMVRTGDLTAAEVMMETDNPLSALDKPALFSNQYVRSVGGSATSYWVGDFKKAFGERVIYPPQVQMQDRSSESGFNRDIVSRIKVRRRSVPFVREWRYVQKHTA